MSPIRALSFASRLLLALLLGLGPLTADALAWLAHAPLCACAGCEPDAASASCCATPADQPAAPAIDDATRTCSCALVRPSDAPVPASDARTAESRPAGRSQLELLRRGLELVPAVLADAHVARAPVKPPRVADESGPPGVHRAHGAARSSALGALLL